MDREPGMDLIASRRAERNGLSLRFGGRVVILVPDWPGDGAGPYSNGKSLPTHGKDIGKVMKMTERGIANVLGSPGSQDELVITE